jgi:hypothetical protein
MTGRDQDSIFRFRETLPDTNPLYRGLIRAEFWAATRPNGQLMVLRILPFVLGPIAIVIKTGPAAVVLYVVTFALIAIGFELEQITGLTVLSSARDRAQLSRGERLAAISFGAFLAAAVVCLLGADYGRWPVGAAAGCVAWALIGGFVQLEGDTMSARVLRWSPVAAGVLGVVTLALGASGADGAAFVVGLVFALSVLPAVCTALTVRFGT